jgi:hypothetical protein
VKDMPSRYLKRTIQNHRTVLSFAGIIFLLFLPADFTYAQDAVQQEPAFLRAGEKVKKIINENIYAVDTGTDKDLIRARRHEFTKLYFTDEKKNVLTTFEIYPEDSKQQYCLLDSYTDHQVLYRTYVQNGEKTEGGFVFNNLGKVLWKWDGDIGRVYWSPEKKQVLVINGMSGVFKVFSANGAEILEKIFSNYAEPTKVAKGDDDDEDDEFGVSYVVPSDGEFVAVGRNKPTFHELTLFGLDGKIYFQLKGFASHTSPIYVDSSNHVVVMVSINDENSQALYTGYDFTGSKIWSLDRDSYYLDIDHKDGIIRVKQRNNPSLDTHQKIDLKSGNIVAE